MKTKTCPKCKLDLPVNEFGKHTTRKDGLAVYCKKCQYKYQKQWYEKHKKTHIKNARIATVKARDRNRDYAATVLLESGCTDCGETNLIVLEFDHVHGKKITEVSNIISGGYSLQLLKDEIAKCEVVCANCHRIRTAKRNGGHWTNKYASIAQL